LVAGGLRKEPHPNWNVAAAETVEKKRTKKDKAPVKRAKNKGSDAAFLARLARLKKKLAKPQLTKSVRERATEKQIGSGSAG
jgi:hypothetical protein